MNKIIAFAPRMLVLGLVLMLLGFSLAGFSMENLDTHGPYEEKVFESDAPVTSVSIEDRNNDIVVAQSSDGKLRVTYYDSEKEHYEVGLGDDGRLTVRYVSDMKWYERWGITVKDTRIVVELPEGSVVPFEIVSVNGRTDMSNVHLASLQVKKTNGGTFAHGVQVDEGIDISDVNGEIDLNDVSARTVDLETTNGEISLVTVRADQVEAHTTNGAIRLQGVDAGSGDYRTTNGSIRGDVVGTSSEYSVESRTRLGSNNAPSGGNGPRKLRLETTAGSIDVRCGGE